LGWNGRPRGTDHLTVELSKGGKTTGIGYRGTKVTENPQGGGATAQQGVTQRGGEEGHTGVCKPMNRTERGNTRSIHKFHLWRKRGETSGKITRKLA